MGLNLMCGPTFWPLSDLPLNSFCARFNRKCPRRLGNNHFKNSRGYYLQRDKVHSENSHQGSQICLANSGQMWNIREHHTQWLGFQGKSQEHTPCVPLHSLGAMVVQWLARWLGGHVFKKIPIAAGTIFSDWTPKMTQTKMSTWKFPGKWRQSIDHIIKC